MSQQNYNQILEQFISLAKFGQSAYKSGERNQESKKKIRKQIYNFVSRLDDENSISTVIDEAREMLEDYIHDFGNPKVVPDFIFDHLDDIKTLIKSVDNYDPSSKDSNGNSLNMDLDDVMFTLIERYIRTSSKILRLSFAEKAPPMTLPSANDLHVPRAEQKSRFA